MTASPFGTIRDVVEANEKVGQYWFSRATMHYFHSRIETGLIRGRYFVTSDQSEDGTSLDVKGNLIPETERRYTVRVAKDDGKVETFGDFMAFGSTAEAMEFILQQDNPA